MYLFSNFLWFMIFMVHIYRKWSKNDCFAPQPTTRQHVCSELVPEIISFVLYKDHEVTTSWENQSFILSKFEKVVIPRLCIKLTPRELWNGYNNHVMMKYRNDAFNGTSSKANTKIPKIDFLLSDGTWFNMFQ